MAVGVRLAAIGRAPDIDELFTVWITERSIADMMATLRLDSGPPLYYLLLKPFRLVADPVLTFRTISLLAGVATVLVAVMSTRERATRLLIASLIALHPLSVFFSTRGRAYSLMALLVVASAIALVRWLDSSDRRMLVIGSAAILIAAYTHYYAIYLFPLPLIVALTAGRERVREGAIATFAVGALFMPGIVLLLSQPSGALSWMHIEDDLQRILFTAGSFGRLGFDGRQRLPVEWSSMVLHLSGLVLLLVALLGTRASLRASRHLLVVLTAISGAIAAAVLGFSAYFPLRFESILIGPVVIFYVLSIRELPSVVYRALATAALIVAALATAAMVINQQPSRSPARQVALELKNEVPSEALILTSGPVFFELRSLTDQEWAPELRVFPRDREIHPGHRGTAEMIEKDLERLRSVSRSFLWVGPAGSLEDRALQEQLGGRVVADRYGLRTILVHPRKSIEGFETE